MLIATFMTAFLAAGPLASPIVVDGEMDDWGERPPMAADAVGDAAQGRVDFGRLWMAHDADAVYLRLEVGNVVGLQDVGTGVRLAVDAGEDARLEWDFSDRRGRLGDGSPADFRALGLVSAPTVTSDAFEITFARDRLGLADGKALRLVFSAPGDRLPDSGAVTYTPDAANTLPPVAEIPLGKQDPGHLRVLSYNTNNRLFEPHRKAAYERILKAVAPDVLLLQEVRDNTSEEVAKYLGDTLRVAGDGSVLHHAQAGGEATVVLSRFAMARVEPLGESAAFVLDGVGRPGEKVLLVALSMPCCGHHAARRQEADLIMAYVRKARQELPPQTPIALIGDANLVGPRDQRTTLLDGSILDRERYGPAFAPDWDATAFTDVVPRHTHRPLTFTWYGDGFLPGRLDYAIVSDSVVRAARSYVLFTPHMSPASLERHGLRADDVLVATDHLPLVVDLELKKGEQP